MQAKKTNIRSLAHNFASGYMSHATPATNKTKQTRTEQEQNRTEQEQNRTEQNKNK